MNSSDYMSTRWSYCRLISYSYTLGNLAFSLPYLLWNCTAKLYFHYTFYFHPSFLLELLQIGVVNWWWVYYMEKKVACFKPAILHNTVEVLRASGPVESRGRPPSCHRCCTTSTIWLEETRRSSKNHLAENDWGGLTVTEFWGPHGMEEGRGERYLATGRQYGNALLGVCHQEKEERILHSK